MFAQARPGWGAAAQAQFRLGVCCYKKQDFATGAAAFDQVIKNYPGQTELVTRANDYLYRALPLLAAPWEDGEELRFVINALGGQPGGSVTFAVNAGETNGQKFWRTETLFTSLFQNLMTDVAEVDADLVLLDLMLPKLDGYEVCRQARQQGLTLPIIMLTARGQEDDIVRGLELGADDYVTKPFSIRELLARVRAFLRRHATEPAVYEFGGCRLDLAARKLFRDGRELALTAKEFRLLEFFLRRRGRALTRDTILDGVWGRGVFVTDRSVDRCVTTLRAKLEADPHNPCFIRTIRDIGYRFEIEDPDIQSGSGK